MEPVASNVKNEVLDSCRTCMIQEIKMNNIFDESFDIPQKVLFCTGLQFKKQDGLPSLMCDKCLLNLTEAYQFKIKSIETNKKLQTLINVVKVEELCESFNDDTWPSSPHEEFVKKEDVSESKINIDLQLKNEKSKPSLRIVKKKPPTRKKSEKQENVKSSIKKIKLWRHWCTPCGVKFDTKKLWSAHRRELHKDEEESWVCELCGKKFVFKSSLTCHIRSHFPPDFFCDQCDYKTSNKFDLIKHVRIHSGIKMYQCQHCKGQYRTSSNLVSHIRRNHEKRKPHACTKCDKRFFDHTMLKRHLDSHNNIKRHECELCHSIYSHRRHWKRHLQREHNITIPAQRPGRRRANPVIEEEE